MLFLEVAQLLLSNGADKNVMDFNGITPLYLAILIGDLNFLRNFLDTIGKTPTAAKRKLRKLTRKIDQRKGPSSFLVIFLFLTFLY